MKLNYLNVFKGKKVFLTGHTGFKGSWMLVWLERLGAIVKGYALEPINRTDLFYEIGGEKLCDSIIGDLREKEKLLKEIKDFQPDFIFHLAAQALVRESYRIPVETYEVNSIGTAILLESARSITKKCAVVCITTDKVYHNKEWVYPYREEDALGGYDAYSASKACAEIIINSYRQSFFNLSKIKDHNIAISSARAGNVIGGGDWAKDRIIPDIIRALKTNSSIEVRSPNAVRPWQHVLEPIGAYLLLGAKMYENPIKYSQGWNFGPETKGNIPVRDIVELAIKFWGSGHFHSNRANNELHEAGLLKLDSSKAASLLRWKPKLSVPQAIEFTINWYKNESKLSAYERTVNDIEKYNAL